MKTNTILAPVLLLLTACVAAPVFDINDIDLDSSLNPSDISERPDAGLGRQVLWGGIILDTRNLTDVTQIEVLAYPLDDRFMPSLRDVPEGRFIILHPGYLEPVSYAQGRQVSVLGELGEARKGRVGDSQYLYPVVNAEKVHLWPEGGGSRTTFHFGFGIQL